MERVINHIYLFIASGFGIGFIALRVAVVVRNFSFISFPERWSGSGLFGTLLGWFLIYNGIAATDPSRLSWLIFATVLSIHISGKAEQLLQVKDPQHVVIDEVIGIYWATACLPEISYHGDFKNIILISAFLLFRIFDVLKFPIKRAQNLKGGLGVVMDDLLAGLAVNCILQFVIRWGI